MQLWRATPLARADFGRGTVWHACEHSARKTLAAFSEGLADPVGLYTAEVVPQHVVYVPNGLQLPSDQAMVYAGELVAEKAGHRWLALWDGPQPGGPWEIWLRLADEPIEARPVRDAEVFVPPDWR